MVTKAADLVFRNGLIVTPSGTIEGGVAILDGKIAAVGSDGPKRAAEEHAFRGARVHDQGERRATARRPRVGYSRPYQDLAVPRQPEWNLNSSRGQESAEPGSRAASRGPCVAIGGQERQALGAIVDPHHEALENALSHQPEQRAIRDASHVLGVDGEYRREIFRLEAPDAELGQRVGGDSRHGALAEGVRHS